MSRIDWNAAPSVMIELPTVACPFCGNFEPPITMRSERCHAEQVRKSICRACSKPFKIIVGRLPANGNDVLWDSYD